MTLGSKQDWTKDIASLDTKQKSLAFKILFINLHKQLAMETGIKRLALLGSLLSSIKAIVCHCAMLYETGSFTKGDNTVCM